MDSWPSHDAGSRFFFEFAVSDRVPGRRGVSRRVDGVFTRHRDPTRVYVVIRTPSTRCHVGPFEERCSAQGMEWLAFERFAATWKDYEAAYGYQEMFYWKMGRAGLCFVVTGTCQCQTSSCASIWGVLGSE